MSEERFEFNLRNYENDFLEFYEENGNYYMWVIDHRYLKRRLSISKEFYMMAKKELTEDRLWEFEINGAWTYDRKKDTHE